MSCKLLNSLLGLSVRKVFYKKYKSENKSKKIVFHVSKSLLFCKFMLLALFFRERIYRLYVEIISRPDATPDANNCAF